MRLHTDCSTSWNYQINLLFEALVKFPWRNMESPSCTPLPAFTKICSRLIFSTVLTFLFVCLVLIVYIPHADSFICSRAHKREPESSPSLNCPFFAQPTQGKYWSHTRVGLSTCLCQLLDYKIIWPITSELSVVLCSQFWDSEYYWI